MMDVISMLHKDKKFKHLNEGIQAGQFFMSIQADSHHYCEPRADLPPYMFYSFEVAIYGNVPESIKQKFRGFEACPGDEDTIYYGFMPTNALQMLYEMLLTWEDF